MDSNQQFKVIGLMSGTSLDGVDLACCTFSKSESWTFTIDYAETILYPKQWYSKLKKAHTLSGEELVALDVLYGNLLGEFCGKFIEKNKIKKIDFIASHGHTVFHQPAKGFTYQIGNGNAIHVATGLPVVNDFRSLDVMLGGQGAPLVPIGDRLLFGEYDICLNLGGIGNFSFEQKGKQLAYDIAYVNMGLNHLAGKIRKKFDRNGDFAAKGELNQKLLKQLDNAYERNNKTHASLGREFFEVWIQPLLDQEKISVQDRLRTFTESAAKEIVNAILRSGKNQSVLCTGGGAFNSFLMYRLIELCGDEATFIIPDDEIVKFKEALVFAFLGVLRVMDEVNCLKSVTGAKKDSSSGVMVGF